MRKKINTLLESLNELNGDDQVMMAFATDDGYQFKTDFNFSVVKDNTNKDTYKKLDTWKEGELEFRDVDFYAILKK